MGEISDLIFTLLGKAGRWLNVKGRRACFIVWGVCLCYWMCRNIMLGLQVQTVGCFVSLGFHIYGYVNWKKEGIGK